MCQMLYGKHGGVEGSKTLEVLPLKALKGICAGGTKQIVQMMILIFSGKGIEGSLLS